MAFKHVAADENETPRDPWQGAAGLQAKRFCFLNAE
jgi:hypothetical protein